MIELLILADDFTGALDTGVQFAQNSIGTVVLTDRTFRADLVDETKRVLVIDTETRHLKPDDAYRIVHRIVKDATAFGIRHIYKKTDSALRGNVGSELTAALRASRQDRLSFVPAYPAMQRYTRGGVQYYGDLPIHQSVLGQDPFDPVQCSYIPDLIAQQSDAAVSTIDPAAQHTDGNDLHGIVCYDCETDAEMSRLAARLYRADGETLLAGCAGMAAALASLIGETRQAVRLETCGGLIVLNGSLNPVSGEQVRYASEDGFTCIVLDEKQKLDRGYFRMAQGRSFLDGLTEAYHTSKRLILSSGVSQNVISEAEQLDENRRRISENLGELAAALMRSCDDAALFVVGGDTLMGFLNSVECEQIEPICEIQSGTVAFHIVLDGRKRLVAAKSGGFGGPDLLVNAARQLL